MAEHCEHLLGGRNPAGHPSDGIVRFVRGDLQDTPLGPWRGWTYTLYTAGVTTYPYVPWAPPDYLPSLERLADAMTGTLAGADLDAEVPFCPNWTVRDLAAHVTHVHLWARGAIVGGHPDTPPPPAPADADAAAAEYRAAADALIETLRNTDPSTECWTFGPKPRRAAFWFRRQPHEIAVHLVDALASQGLEAVLDQRLALDGIDEVVSMFFPRQVRLKRTPPLERSLALVAERTPYRWVLAGDGTGTGADGSAVRDGEATATGPASSILLLLWRRIGLDDPSIRVTGDVAAAHAVLEAAITP